MFAQIMHLLNLDKEKTRSSNTSKPAQPVEQAEQRSGQDRLKELEERERQIDKRDQAYRENLRRNSGYLQLAWNTCERSRRSWSTPYKVEIFACKIFWYRFHEMVRRHGIDHVGIPENDRPLARVIPATKMAKSLERNHRFINKKIKPLDPEAELDREIYESIYPKEY